MSDHDLGGFDRDSVTHDGLTHEVLRRSTGPAEIVIAAMPGITPGMLEFAERVAAIGCTAGLPRLFGEPGRDPQSVGPRHPRHHRPSRHLDHPRLREPRVHRVGHR
ncbi:hypothetical protein [Pseudonocardia spinosispora]|uniref:hypothetical protein n=1 Tax=Pseudonocardia spinosispora TaxID=103441 RepID=UPI0003F5139A|nr:hypothetical protein [Pseudonocardia spinosispora]